jgi:Asp-tRNA(Asn)/Glu-tRNA(Gln) amidotransferase A subunit family amidase
MTRTLDLITIGRSSVDLYGDQIGGRLEDMGSFSKALAAARAAEQEIRAGKYRGPLHGVPIAVKDLCHSKGVRTMGGTSVLKGFVPDFDATVVSRLYAAGAVVLGKLNY